MAESNVNIRTEVQDLYNASICLLSTKTKRSIALLLDPIKVIPTEQGLARDWRGLLQLTGVGGEKLPYLQSIDNPTVEVLTLWFEKNKQTSIVKTFLLYLEELDRYDVIDDVKELIDEDIKEHNKNIATTITNTEKLDLESEQEIITHDDVSRLLQGLEPQNYDAFVLFADADEHLANNMINEMETQRNLKFCVKDRDLVGGAFKHQAIIKLIAERCNRLIVILTPAFFKSPENKFFLNIAQVISINKELRKIIPCIFCKSEIPPELSMYHMLDFTRNNKFSNVYDKLHLSVAPAQKRITLQVNASTRDYSTTVTRKEENLSSVVQVKEVKSDSNTTESKVVDPVTDVNSDSNMKESKKENKSKWYKKKLFSIKSNSEVKKDKQKNKFFNVKQKIAVAN